ncbi:rRNA maturation RNase YbeY [Psychrobacter urativorans]|uniref:Endoribonuclease YbeY n=1 Tax=Psychrobacter urativorans TaxID=45610 RepID=A0A0M4TBS1_9GAMM|nr:rRNA maturation RNase YbeY [Psychrobacter urativorans]ALF59182.1 rRNA maturation RNase YbeY [Psychrobacter urativorans]
MSQSNNENYNMNNTDTNNLDLYEITISAADSIDAELINSFYSEETLYSVLGATLDYIAERMNTGLVLPYFADIDNAIWAEKVKGLDIYITDAVEGRELNVEARGKDYPTNILSYPSEMPASIIELMSTLPLGEFIICHEVVVREAAEQDKTIEQHISHLLVHGILHLLGFDHELGQAEQDEMESFEIDILAQLNLPNPYL